MSVSSDALIYRLTTSRDRYGPAIRELFSYVVLQYEDHATSVLNTLRQNAERCGGLHTHTRKLCLLVRDETDNDDNDDDLPKVPKPTVLRRASGLMVLNRLQHINNLTIRLPNVWTILDDEVVQAITQLPLLRRFEVSARVSFTRLWTILKATPLLTELDVRGLRLGDDISTISESDLEGTTFSLTSLSMADSDLSSAFFIPLLVATRNTLQTLHLSDCAKPNRSAFKQALQLVGKNLHSLTLNKVIFLTTVVGGGVTPDSNILDDLPRMCPLLTELSIGTNMITSADRFLQVVVPSLFLTQLELNYAVPKVTEESLLEMIRKLPTGRMESISLGPYSSKCCTDKVMQACQKIGITLLQEEPVPETPATEDEANN